MYIATIWLEYKIANTKWRRYAQPVFDTDIWPLMIRTWEALPIDGEDDEDFVEMLNDEFVNNLSIYSPQAVNKVILPPFEATSWHVGPGGLHEAERKPVKYDSNVAYEFEFDVPGELDPQIGQVYVRLRFFQVSLEE